MFTHSRFNLAFDQWMTGDLDRCLCLWREPEYARIGVLLTLHRFHPFIRAHLCRELVEVWVEWEGEPWGKLFARDLKVLRGPTGGWISARDEADNPHPKGYAWVMIEELCRMPSGHRFAITPRA